MKTVKVFKIGRSQMVRLPNEFRFHSREVCITRIGSAVVLFEPASRLKMLLGALGRETPDFMAQRRQPKAAERRPHL